MRSKDKDRLKRISPRLDADLWIAIVRGVFPILLFLFLPACSQRQMQDQPRYEPYEESALFSDHRSVRAPVAGTVARGHADSDDLFFRGRINGTLVDSYPFVITADKVAQGAGLYQSYCAPCHGFTGRGDGRIVQRGFTPPPELYSDRVLAKPLGHYFEVIRNGYGAMPAYGPEIDAEQRWLIISYLEALQYSQRAERDPRIRGVSR